MSDDGVKRTSRRSRSGSTKTAASKTAKKTSRGGARAVVAHRVGGRAQEARRLNVVTARIGEDFEPPEIAMIATTLEETVDNLGKGTARERAPLTGEELPRPSEMKRIQLENLRRGFAARRRLLDDTLSVAEVAELLGTRRQTPHDRRKAGTLLGIRDKGEWRFPTWQFDPAGPDGVIAGLPHVLRALAGPLSELARISWFVTPKPLLDGKTPLEALRQGDVDDVVAEASSVGVS